MNEKKYAGPGDLQIPLLALIFLLCLSVLLPLFAKCWQVSRENAEKNLAVELCRNAAEAYSAVPDTAEVSYALGGDGGAQLCYDREGQLCAREEAVLILSLASREEDTPRGVMHKGKFKAVRGNKILYRLEVCRYVSGEEGGAENAG